MRKKAVSRKGAKALLPKASLSPKAKAKPQFAPGEQTVLRNVTRYMEYYLQTTGIPVSRVSVHAWMKSGRLQVDHSTGTPLIVGDACPQKQRNNSPAEVLYGEK